MKHSLSLRLRVTLVCGVLLAVCCLLLTLSHNYYAYEMADAIEAIPLQPSQSVEKEPGAMVELMPGQVTVPAREAFRMQSLVAMGVIVAAGCLMVYWLTGKALAPDLSRPLPVPTSGDEVAGLTVSFNQMSQNLGEVFEQQKRFSQCAAHELRTPLAVLKTRMALFRKKGLCATPETEQLLDTLEDQTQRLSDLVNDLLALSNLDDLECTETIDAARLLSDAVENLAQTAQLHAVSLQLQTQPGAAGAGLLQSDRKCHQI